MLFLAFLDDFFDFPLLADACSAPTFGGIKDGLFNSEASLLTGDVRRAASAPFGADLACDRPPDPFDVFDFLAAGAAPGVGLFAGFVVASATFAHVIGLTVSPAPFSAGSNEARTVIRPNSSAISVVSAQSDVSIRFTSGGAPSAPFGAEVAIDVGVFFSSATLAELWIGSLAFRFRVSLLPSVSLFAEGSSFSGGAENGIWEELFGSFTDLPAWFVSGSSSSSMETLYDIFQCRMSQILRILRNKEGELFSKRQASIVYVS